MSQSLSLSKKVFLVFLAISAIIFLPYIGGYIHYDGKFPADFFAFPPLVAPPKAGFSMFLFVSIAIIFFMVVLLYAFPRLFGFKAVQKTKTKKHTGSIPFWFWIGLVMWGGTLFILWGKFSQPKIIINWAVLPLFWGFALMLDGIVFKRKGNSLLSRNPQELLAMGLASISGWLIFEFLNFFVDDNWLYPKGTLISGNEFFLYAVVGSSGLMPMAFEWYDLFNSFDGFRKRYENGIKLSLPQWLKYAILIGCLVGLIFISFFPNILFFLLWVAPLIILGIVLNLLKIWTPLDTIKDGNWSPTLILALTYLTQGFLCECWNYFSGVHENGQLVSSHNPDYWVYSIPYVDVLHVFEMPLLGFLGYLPFGIYCGIWWITFTFLFGVTTQFNEHHLDDI